MTLADERWPIPLPPGEDELPYDDGEPRESDRHRQQMNLLIESLELAWKDREDVYVGGNMALYFSELQIKKNDFRAPDFFVVLDTTRRDRKSWVVWQEERAPDLVIELLSESTEAVDRGDKMRIYAKVVRVPEYYLFDPWSGVFEGYALDQATRSYKRMAPAPGGEIESRMLGLRLGIRRGSYQGVEADWLRFIDAEGRVLPTGEEAAREATKRAEELAARLAEYEKRFGKL